MTAALEALDALCKSYDGREAAVLAGWSLVSTTITVEKSNPSDFAKMPYNMLHRYILDEPFKKLNAPMPVQEQWILCRRASTEAGLQRVKLRTRPHNSLWPSRSSKTIWNDLFAHA
jgi:hypothetical protein